MKPIGVWGPVRSTLDRATQEAIHPEMAHDLMTSALGILFYFVLTVSLFSLLGGSTLQGLTVLSAAVVSGILFAKIAISRLKRTATAIVVPESATVENREPFL